MAVLATQIFERLAVHHAKPVEHGKTGPVSGWNAVEMLKTLGSENHAARSVENKSGDARPGDFCCLLVLEHRSRFTESGSSIEMRRIPPGGTKCEIVCAL